MRIALASESEVRSTDRLNPEVRLRQEYTASSRPVSMTHVLKSQRQDHDPSESPSPTRSTAYFSQDNRASGTGHPRRQVRSAPPFPFVLCSLCFLKSFHRCSSAFLPAFSMEQLEASVAGIGLEKTVHHQVAFSARWISYRDRQLLGMDEKHQLLAMGGSSKDTIGRTEMVERQCRKATDAIDD